MKKILVGLAAMAFVLAPHMSVLAAGAATMQFDGAGATLAVGETKDVTLVVVPNGEELDTVRSVFTFDPAQVQVEQVRRIGVFDRSAPGNFIDNQSGKVSWGAFTLNGPVTAASPTFLITVRARQQGTARIVLTDASRAISGGEERLAAQGLGTFSLDIAAAEATDTGRSAITVSSESHPQPFDWYANKDVSIAWTEVPGTSAVRTYFYAFDASSDTDPATAVPASQTRVDFKQVEDGVHYFHIKGRQEDGAFTKTVHRRVQVDTVNPNPIALTVSTEQLIEGESLWMTFATTDEHAGVDQYKLSINTSEFLVQTSPLELTDLVAGTYFLRIAALDRAGNVTYQGKSVRVYPVGTELNRPDNFDPNSEITALSTFPEQQTNASSGVPKLLITFVLVVAAAFGIIYAIKKQKIK